ncbi:MAG: cupin, partial [Klebsiella michiganensis]|nr:cupin [Klebsiella michiganensis]
MKRPDCIRHWRELEGVDDSTYPDSTELFSIGAPLARGLRLNR